MNEILTIIIIPIVVGLALFIIPQKLNIAKGILAIIVSLITLFYSSIIFVADQFALTPYTFLNQSESTFLRSINFDLIKYSALNIDSLNQLIILFISIFGFLILVYSIIYISKEKKISNYYEYFLITLGCSYGAAASDNLLLFLTFWGVLGLTLYKLIKGHDEESSAAAKKTLIIVGASDGIMILGIGILWKITGTLNMSDIMLATSSPLTVTAFFALLIGSFTKAGAFPFHSWIPDYAKSAPASSSALLPASLDKLLGIYFLARICNYLFVLNDWLRVVLLAVGVITIITAVMMALIQHDYKKLLGFHAVSQVGYMVVGFGLGTMLGIAAGLFHMINHALYKSGLLLSAGSVEHRTGKNNIEEVGGLSKVMPITFIAALIFALSISGIPPLNGFASKWMIYQGIIEFGSGTGVANSLWIVWLGLAILGSALTLASFIKFIGGIFLGRKKEAFKNIKEVSPIMWIPLVTLALFCVGFGVFASGYVIPKLFYPITGEFSFVGIWQSETVSLLILLSIVLGIIIYFIGNIRKFRTEDSFVGGGEKMRELGDYNAVEFYKTISEFKLFNYLYQKAEEKWFDIYDLSKRLVLWFSHLFSTTHNGILSNYAIWVFAGIIIMLLIMT
ncbi:MAG: proton-conducting transporter membrane subunit [Bacteroidales bacterium]|jgi:formate hydrogenlyase subunit 3/multisubunit Na+/H+ antiporter MnhD subunit|nr:proton-conducting transporter membrane subunit [Bacteroidales bacterium]